MILVVVSPRIISESFKVASHSFAKLRSRRVLQMPTETEILHQQYCVEQAVTVARNGKGTRIAFRPQTIVTIFPLAIKRGWRYVI